MTPHEPEGTIGLWKQVKASYIAVLRAENNYSMAIQAFLSCPPDRMIELLKDELKGPNWKVAIVTLEQLDPRSLLPLFPELISLCSHSHAATDVLRKLVLSMPRDWVLENIGREAEPILASGTYDEYRRILELYSHLDAGLTRRLARSAAEHPDADIRDAGLDFLGTTDTGSDGDVG